MDDRFRTSDADRDRVAELLRDHFAAGRLSREELDERLTATLSAKTVGDLRRVLADLPEPAGVLRPSSRVPPRAASAWVTRHRGPRILPLAVLALVAALLIPGAGWILLAFFQAVLLLWLAACLAGIFMAARFYRRMRRDWWSGQDHRRRQGWPGSGSQHRYGYWHPFDHGLDV
jgi:Domain of unknown function (DUF1707)